jgi:hypothetical protein
MDMILEVLKWVALILLAGFIGQFGKSLSIHIIDYLRRRKNKASGNTIKGTDLLPIVQDKELSAPEGQPLSKADKKAVKAQIKAQKKAPKG